MDAYLEKASALVRCFLRLCASLGPGSRILARPVLRRTSALCVAGLLLVAAAPVHSQHLQYADQQVSQEVAGLAFSGTHVQAHVPDASSELSRLPELQRVISVRVEDLQLGQVLRRILEKGDLQLIYGNHPVLLQKKVTLDLEKVTVREAIEEVTRGTDLKLMRSRNGRLVLVNTGLSKVVPRSAESTKTQAIGTLRLQEGQVTGTVTDGTTGSPLPGVNILIVGTQQGSSTDGNGEYTISGIEPGTYALRASFIGYSTAVQENIEVVADETTVVDFALEPAEIGLDNVVVTALGVEREERSLTYGTEEVETEELAEARELNVVNSLSGRVAGLSINQAGTGVGGASRVLLRGNRSISGSSQPLYVVDGVPMRGDINNLNPDVIETINVLKGPNAAALYGSEAQNGAIVITTSKPDAGGVDVSFSQNLTFNQPIMLREYQNEYGQGANGEYSPSSEFAWGPRMEGQMVDHWSPDPGMSGEQYAFEAHPDNVRNAFRTGYNSATNLTASIGGDVAQSLFSYSFTDAQGVVSNNALQRHNVQMRVTSQLSDKFSLDGKLSYVQEQTDNPLVTGENFANPVRHIYRMPRNISAEAAENFEYVAANGTMRQHFWNPGSNGGANPYWTLNRNLSMSEERQVLAMASMTYDFTDNLSLMARGSYDGITTASETKRYNDTYVIAENGYYGIGKSNAYLLNTDALLSYTREVNRDWHVDVNLGGSIRRERNNILSANTGTALTIPNFFAISNTQNVVASENIGAPRDVHSVYSFAQVGWRDAVYLDVTGRNDWSSTLPADSRSYFYPSVGVSAVLTDLIPSLPEAISYAKVNGSWARVGNSADPFSLQRTASLSSGGNNGFLTLSTELPNTELKPEETVSRELGLDARFLNSRLGLQVTAYRTNTRNQLFTVALPVGSGAALYYTNGGNVENEGVEVLLDVTPVQAMDFTWNVSANFSKNRNTVVELSEERPILTLASDFLREFRIVEGEAFGQVYSRGFARVEKGAHEGSVIVNSDGMPEFTSGKDVPVANFTPDWMGGIRSSFSYKNVDFSFLIDHRQGGTVASLTNAILDYNGLTKRSLIGRENGFVFGEDIYSDETVVEQVGVDGNGDPVYEPTTPQSVDPESFWRAIGGRNTPVGEAFVESATNTRLREVTLGYTLPQSVASRLSASNLRISVVGRNLFFLYRASDTLDPDLMVGTNAAAEGFESFTPPSTRTFGANLQITF